MQYILKKILFSIIITTSLVSSEITIAVAANVSHTIQALIKAFNTQNPDIKVNVVMGSSGKLTAQITHGAPYDIFMSANMKYPNTLYENSLAMTRPIIYAQGALVILSSKKRDYRAKIFVLKEENIKKIAIANPKTAPYGAAAMEALKNAKLYTQLKNKFVYGESISQTVLYAARIADIGIIAKSSLYAPQMSGYKEAIHWTEVNSKLYTPIDQGIVMLKHARKSREVKAFYDFILGKQAQEILKSFGYNIK
jgi:molybdate transport system substrate-binding protein